jgi:2-hydroxychromene-2-carboxylate isomerase
MAGSSTADRFHFDLAWPQAYVVAEERLDAEWVPVRIEPSFRCAEEVAALREDVERAAAARGLLPVRWPEPFPADTDWAMLVATYAKQIGRAVAFSLAAFRQAFAGGRDLGDRDTVLIAAAACEMHPAAVMKGAALRSTRERLERATAEALAGGVRAP